jgi:hypothetical protein
MTAHLHSALFHRYAVPAWLLAAVIAAVVALALVAVLDGPAELAASPSPAPAPAGSCLDAAVVGHC